MSDDKTPHNFADHPVSIAEIVSEKAQDGTKWTVRDALIWLLREIDSGRIQADTTFISYRQVRGEEDGDKVSRFLVAGPDAHTPVGVAQFAINKYMNTYLNPPS